MAKRGQEISRERRKRTPKPIVVIVCEGSKTEPTYFRYFKSRFVNIQIEVEGNKSTGNKTDFNHLIKKSVSKKKEYITDTEGEGYVWCVFDADVDFNTPNAIPTKNGQLQKVAKEADENGINIAMSNPCFELWFLLHFGFTTSPMKNYEEVKKKLVAHLPGYKKNVDVYNELTNRLNDAIDNAKCLKQHHNKNGASNLLDVSVTPYTNVWELIEEIQKLSSKQTTNNV